MVGCLIVRGKVTILLSVYLCCREVYCFSVWLQLLDRNQQRLQVVRISLSCFNSDVEIAHSHGHRIPGIQLLKEETSDVWINVDACTLSFSGSYFMFD